MDFRLIYPMQKYSRVLGSGLSAAFLSGQVAAGIVLKGGAPKTGATTQCALLALSVFAMGLPTMYNVILKAGVWHWRVCWWLMSGGRCVRW